MDGSWCGLRRTASLHLAAPPAKPSLTLTNHHPAADPGPKTAGVLLQTVPEQLAADAKSAGLAWPSRRSSAWTNSPLSRPATSNPMLTSSSCQAVRNAVSTLYNMDDFHFVKIGEGFFSEVFKVVEKRQGKVMVLKKNKHPAQGAAMLKEIQLMNSLRHENIIRLVGACVDRAQLHALTEFADGGSLDALIQKVAKSPEACHVSWPWLQRVWLSRDVCKGMSYLHSRRLFHRDLTSKNILIRMNKAPMKKTCSAVVADLGLATAIPKSCDDRLPQVGSPYWMSPECLRGQYYDQSADVFSFGIILCELIACVEADPDVLPRTQNFGVDYLAFSEMVPSSCPLAFLKLAFSCVTIDPHRPTFDQLQLQLHGQEVLLNQCGLLLQVDSAAATTTVTTVTNESPSQPSASTSLPAAPSGSSSGSVTPCSMNVTSSTAAELAVPPSGASPKTASKNGCSSRRCFSQRKLARCSPSETARHHQQPVSGWPRLARLPLSETPLSIGEQMSKLDPHYIPSPAEGINPFAQLPKHLQQMGPGKILEPKDLFTSCFELPRSDTMSSNAVSRKAVSLIVRGEHLQEAFVPELTDDGPLIKSKS